MLRPPTSPAAMLHLADTFEIDVSVVWTGHPLLVFATNRPGDHPQGRAFDSYRIEGRLVVDPATPRCLWSLASCGCGLGWVVQRWRPVPAGLRPAVLQ